MKLIVDLTSDEVREMIPYQLICETMNSPRWNTTRRRIMQKEWFTQNEITRLSSYRRVAENWTIGKGVPSHLTITVTTLNFWQKLGLFCGSI